MNLWQTIKAKKPKKFTQTLFIVALLVITVCNLAVYRWERQRINNFKKVMRHQIVGFEFKGLNTVIPDEVDYMGYYSCGPLEKKNDVRTFAHAQFVLAPKVLEHGNLDHKYILFVCPQEDQAWAKIKQIRGRPLKRNKFGMILVKKGY